MKFILFLFLSCGYFQVFAANKLNLSYTLDNYYLKKTNEKESFETIGVFILSEQYDLDHLVFHASLMLNHTTSSPTDDYLFDAQVASNIDTQGGQGLKPYELYLGHKFGSSSFIRGGLIDLSSFLNITQSSLPLINSSFGTSADLGTAGNFGPSIYPIPSWGLAIQKKTKNFYAILTLTDPIAQNNFDPGHVVTKPKINSNHHNSAFELGFLDKLFNKLAIGFWSLEDEDTDLKDSVQGSYFLIDKAFDKHSVFFRFSNSTKVIGKMYQNVALGLSLDPFNFGFSTVRIKGKKKQEKVTEILYNRDLKGFKAALSYQRINNLAGDSKNADVLTLRFILNDSTLF